MGWKPCEFCDQMGQPTSRITCCRRHVTGVFYLCQECCDRILGKNFVGERSERVMWRSRRGVCNIQFSDEPHAQAEDHAATLEPSYDWSGV